MLLTPWTLSILAMIFMSEDLADIIDVFRGTCERSGDEIISHAAAELDVGAVLLADERHRQVRAGQVDALVIGNGAAVDDRTYDLGLCLGIDAQTDQAVIDQDHSAYCDVSRQILVSDGSFFRIAHHFLSGQCESLALLQDYLAAFKIAKTDLRSLGIKQSRYRKAQLTTKANHSAELLLVLFVCAV